MPIYVHTNSQTMMLVRESFSFLCICSCFNQELFDTLSPFLFIKLQVSLSLLLQHLPLPPPPPSPHATYSVLH